MYLEQIRLSWLTFGVAFEAYGLVCLLRFILQPGFASKTSATRLRQLLPVMGGGCSV